MVLRALADRAEPVESADGGHTAHLREAGWLSGRFAADYVFLEPLEFQLDELEQYCEEVEKHIEVPYEEERAAMPATDKAGISGVAFAALALFALLPVPGWGAEACGQRWVDYSGSADAREMALAKQGWLDLVAQAEPTYVSLCRASEDGMPSGGAEIRVWSVSQVP